MLSEFLSIAVDYAWGTPLVLLLMGGGLYLVFVSHFLPLKGFKRAIMLVTGKYHHKGDEKAAGQINHLQALTNALASTVGMGNISGVAFAISQGGAGAIFWMWLAAFIGMNTKFFECTLAVMYRGKDYAGEVQGGPMYVIKNALSKKWHPLAYMFAFCGVMGTLPLFNVNQLTTYASDQFSVSPYLMGSVCAILVSWVLLGGVRSIGQVTSRLVPIMCVFYVAVCMVIIFLNFDKVPSVFVMIFDEAFNGRAALGGVTGMAIAEIMKSGIKRAAFSNEAGVGTAPMAHSNAKTVEPVSEGLVSMIGPFLDTIIVCTMTALVILTSVDLSTVAEGSSGILITKQAFEVSLPGFGNYFLGIAVLLFAVSTILGTANYMQKCWNFLFKGKSGFGNRTFVAVYAVAVMVGAVVSSDDVINFLDICFALMVIPNMIATIILAPKVKQALKEYWAKYSFH